MASRTLVLTVQAWGDLRTGIWCERCQLPSAVEQDVVLSTPRMTVGRRTGFYCVDCDHFETRSPE